MSITRVTILVLLSAAICLSAAISISSEYFKHVQGPPEEFDEHKLPNPSEAGLSSDSALFPIALTLVNNRYQWEADLPIDSTTEASFTVISKAAKSLQVSISRDGSNSLVEPERVDSWFGWNQEDSSPSSSYVLKNPEPGMYTIRVVADEKATVFGLLYNESPFKILAHLSGDYKSLVLNQELYVQTRLYENNANSNAKTAIASNFITADLDVVMPNGEERIITMHDDGLHGDNEANDGIFGAGFVATMEGSYTTKVVMRGITPSTNGNTGGHVFLRSTQHLFKVIENDHLQVKSAAVTVDTQDEMLKLHLIVSCDADKHEHVLGQKFRAYAQVYGTKQSSSTNEMVPVAFVSGMTIAEKTRQASSVQGDASLIQIDLQLSLKWLSRAQATFPLQLNNIYVQDPQNNIPVIEHYEAVNIDQVFIANMANNNLPPSIVNQISNDAKLQRTFATVLVSSLTETKFKFEAGSNSFTETMLFGKRPQKYVLSKQRYMDAMRANNGTNAGGKLILVHGYCAPETPFNVNDFTDYAVFLDKKQSRTHDEFALLVRDFADQFPSFSIAAHSQGGPVSLHLKSFYWSNQDSSDLNDDNHRQIQTIGSPFLGNALAGSLAGIGESIGVGCGENYDLSVDGAKLWYASIPASARKYVYFYTTQYKPLSYCNLAANLVLSWPNDGVAEQKYSILPDGNNMGHTKEQCHSVDMKYPPQCKDAARNAVINAKASR